MMPRDRSPAGGQASACRQPVLRTGRLVKSAAGIRGLLPFTLAAVLLGLASGCAGNKPVYPVSGRIVDADGKPVAGATVIFCPVENVYDNANKPAGLADEQGSFALTTYSQDDGAPAGDYLVTVQCRTGARKSGHAPPDRLGGRFTDPTKTPLRAAVVKGENTVEIKLPLRLKDLPGPR